MVDKTLAWTHEWINTHSLYVSRWESRFSPDMRALRATPVTPDEYVSLKMQDRLIQPDDVRYYIQYLQLIVDISTHPISEELIDILVGVATSYTDFSTLLALYDAQHLTKWRETFDTKLDDLWMASLQEEDIGKLKD